MRYPPHRAGDGFPGIPVLIGILQIVITFAKERCTFGSSLPTAGVDVKFAPA